MEQIGSEKFQWDEAKRQSNLSKHRIDFVDAQELFDGRPELTRRSPYSEEVRFLTTGVIGDRFITVVWTRRNNATRFISARRARDGEIRAYRGVHSGRD